MTTKTTPFAREFADDTILSEFPHFRLPDADHPLEGMHVLDVAGASICVGWVIDAEKRSIRMELGDHLMPRTTPAYTALVILDQQQLDEADPNLISPSDAVRRLAASGLGSAIKKARARLGQELTEAHGSASLRALRLKAGMSQSDLASRMGTSQPRIARIEAGHEKPGWEVATRLADALNVDMNELRHALSG